MSNHGMRLGRTLRTLFVLSDDPHIVIAQCAALSRLIPMMYFILVVNSWMLAASFWADAPRWLTFHVPVGLTLVCCIRLIVWWHSRGAALTLTRARRELNRLPVLTAILTVSFTTWAIALFPYGAQAARGHVIFYLTISMISTMFCLIHVRAAALLLAALAGTTTVVFLLLQRSLTAQAIALNVTLVAIAALIVIFIQNRDFIRMVKAQTRTEALSNENLRLANLDSLTGLPNRRAFFSELEAVFTRSRATAARLAVGIIDLDGFKPVNDLYGHAIGDRLLAAAASRLSALFAPEALFLARLGGDEFAFIITDAPSDGTLARHGNVISEALRTPFVLMETTVQISGSVGIAVYPEMASSAEQLYERSDYALFHGKANNRGITTLFSASHEDRINRDARIEQALKLADFEHELSIVFQPIVDIGRQRVLGFEALARWASPSLGIISPGLFIPIAERASIVGSLTRPLLRKALMAATSWSPDLRLSFNLSAHDLTAAESVLAVIGIIGSSCFPASRLDIEITETAFAHDFEQVKRSIEMLRSLGCSISLDDFGTGYSSLSRLHALPLAKIKIDRSFVTGVDRNASSYKIVKSLLALSRDMGLDCVVEGVETPGELRTLKEMGVSMVQGFFYSPPIAEEDVPRFLEQTLRPRLAAGA